MAIYINLQQTEIDELQTKLEALHAELIVGEYGIREKILSLSSIEGGFYISSISEKIQSLLNELGTGPISQLENVFMNTEQAMQVFIQAVMEVDLCI